MDAVSSIVTGRQLPLYMTIELLTSDAAHERLDDLIELLCDAVESGASIGFLPPLSRESAHTYWLGVLADVQAGRRILLGALAGEGLVGSVQLEFAAKANALH